MPPENPEHTKPQNAAFDSTTLGTKPRKRDRLKRRLKLDDINVVPPTRIKPAISGSVVGNFMEWYDFGIYGYLTVTMTAVFTSGLPEKWQLLAVMFGFAVSFLVRPLGGLVLGPLGDKVGRQKVLFVTMSMMAIATALIGFIPSAQTIGGWALLILYLLKMVQGFSAGGEYAGATTYVTEFSPDKKRGFYSSFLDLGSYIGFAAGATVVAATTVIVNSVSGSDGMMEYGWRIPFFTAIPLGLVAIYLRSRIPETPAFEDEVEGTEAVVEQTPEQRDDPLARHGILGVIRHHWKAILIGMAIVAATNTAGYALTSYVPVFLENEVKLSGTASAMATVPVLVVMSLLLPFVGRLSDRVGRKPVYVMAVVSTLVLMVPAFLLMLTANFALVMLAMCLMAIPVAFYVSISASAIPALFPTASRFAGMGLTYNIAVSLFGGTTPFFTQLLLQATGIDLMPAFYIMFFAAVAGLALIWMRETAKKPLLGSYPTVETSAEAREIFETQDENPDIDLALMPR